MRAGSLLLGLFCALVYLFLLAPIVVVVGASLNAGAFLTFPPQGLSLRWFATFLGNRIFIDAILRSLVLALEATVISGIVGTMAAFYCTRFGGRRRGALQSLILLPIILPEVLTGMALLFFLHALGIGTRHNIGLLIGHVIITLPFVFLNVSTALQGFDWSWELAARSLGARRFTAFRRVVLPLIRNGIINGCLFAFIISFDAFGISFLLKDTGAATLPLQVFDYLRFNFTPEAAAVSTVSILMTLAVIFVTETFFGIGGRRH